MIFLKLYWCLPRGWYIITATLYNIACLLNDSLTLVVLMLSDLASKVFSVCHLPCGPGTSAEPQTFHVNLLMQPISLTYHFLYLKEIWFQQMCSWFNCAPLCCRNSKTMLQRTPGKMPGMLWWGTRRWSRRQTTEIWMFLFVILSWRVLCTKLNLNN